MAVQMTQTWLLDCGACFNARRPQHVEWMALPAKEPDCAKSRVCDSAGLQIGVCLWHGVYRGSRARSGVAAAGIG